MPEIADSRQRERALDPSRSFLVQAPAGSGKTGLLIQRYLRLLSRAEQPQAVIAITFTKKAAGEMRDRVLEALARAQSGRVPTEAHERLTYELARAVVARDYESAWKLAEYPSRLQILTIDALCLQIASRMPLTSGFGAKPGIVEDAAELYAEAARRTVISCEADDRYGAAVRHLLRHQDNRWGTLATLVEGLLARRDQWLPHVLGARDGDAAQTRAGLEANLAEMVASVLEQMRAALPDEFESDLMRLGASGANRCEELAALEGRHRYPSPVAGELASWKALRFLLLTGDGKRRRRLSVREGFGPEVRRERDALGDLIAALPECAVEALRYAGRLPEPRYTDAQWETLRALLDVLPLAAAHLRQVFREQGTVDFCELSQASLAALGSREFPSDLAYALDGRIEHILVDEFQDTSHGQWRLLERLTSEWQAGDGRTLFCVGDPMQSIFRFRQADVSLFLEARRRGIGDVRLEPLTLACNFRSDAAIVQWNNDAFSHVFPASEDERLGAVKLAPSTPVRPARREVPVAVHPFFCSPERPRNDEEEAARVVDLVRAAKLDNPSGTTAILLRARAHASAIAPALRAAGLAFQAVEMDSLAESVVVRDLLALTRALLHPADRVAWFSVLRAPWCGLRLEDLTALSEAGSGETVWETIRGGRASLSDDGRSRLAALERVLSAALRERGRMPVRVWVESTWLALGGPACLRAEPELDDARAFLDLLEQFDRGGDVPDLYALELRMERLYSQPDSRADGTLQLLTMHKAKGLEFDTVIIPGLGRPCSRDEQQLLNWFQHAGTTLLAPIRAAGEQEDELSDFLGWIESRCTQYEQGRLLYVAATRAKRKLHLLGHVAVQEKHGEVSFKPASDSLLNLFWPVLEDSFRAAFDGRDTEAPEDEPERRARRMLVRLPLRWQAPEIRAAAASAESSSAFEAWRGDTPRHTGTAVHAALETIARDGLEAWPGLRLAKERPRWRHNLLSLGVPLAEVEEAVAQVQRAIERTLADERGRWILGSHADAASEYSAGTAAGHFRLDRTFVDEDGTRWIIDYKTSAPAAGEDIDAFLDREQRTYEDQLERYAALYADFDPGRPVRLGLYFPMLSGWREVPLRTGAAAAPVNA